MKTHAQQLGLDCVSRANKTWGKAWRLLSPELQRGAIAVEVLSVLLAQRDESPMTHMLEVARTAYKETWQGKE